MKRRRSATAAVTVTALGLAGAVSLLVLDRLLPPPLAALERPAAVTVLAADGQPLRMFLPADERWRLPVRLGELPPTLPAALVAAEDRRFWSHPGVDPLAVARASWQNLRAGRIVSGASTLPMQLARLAEPAPRTLAAKLREAARALQLERRFSKPELLELYLNLAPYGGNLEGVGAASRFYFGKESAPPAISSSASSRPSSRRGRSPCWWRCRAPPWPGTRPAIPPPPAPPATGC